MLQYRRLGFLMVFLGFISTAMAKDTNTFLQKDCAHRGGKMISSWACPSVDWLREGPFCEIKDRNGVSMVFNGCDVNIAGYGEIFYSACVEHDLCYHHEPVTSGRDKFQCDIRLYGDMMAICRQSHSPRRCEFMAHVYYEGVKLGGERSWSCSKVPADYEQ